MTKGLEILAVIGGGTGIFLIGSYLFYKGNEFICKMASDSANANYINDSQLNETYGKKSR